MRVAAATGTRGPHVGRPHQVQVGQLVQAQDGRRVGLMDVGKTNVAFREATGQAHAVPIGDVCLVRPAPESPPTFRALAPVPGDAVVPVHATDGSLWETEGPQNEAVHRRSVENALYEETLDCIAGA